MILTGKSFDVIMFVFKVTTRLSRRSGTLIDIFFASLLPAYPMYHPVFSQVEYLIISLIVLALMSHVQLLTLLNIYVNNHSNEAMNHFKREITSACLDGQIDSDPNLDPNYNYNIIEKSLQKQSKNIYNVKK